MQLSIYFSRVYICYTGYCSIWLFWIVNPIQIHHKYVIDNPNPNPIFKMDWQSNPDPFTIQQYLEKDKG